ncbi:MAG: hypothetical protein AAF847_17320 [Bacteroidota bacterium]
MELFDQVGNIELKARQLVKRLERLSSSNKNLLEENEALKEMLQLQQSNHTIFKEKILDIKERFEAGEQQDATKIAHYLREITQCVEWMQEQ